MQHHILAKEYPLTEIRDTDGTFVGIENDSGQQIRCTEEESHWISNMIMAAYSRGKSRARGVIRIALDL